MFYLDFASFIDAHRNKKIVVCGLGVSNLPLIRMLRSAGIEIEARDRKTAEQMGKTAEELEVLGVSLVLGDGYLDDLTGDIIYRSPGMRPDVPQFLEAIKHGARLTSEMEAFFEVCPCKIIGITGSEGKTTTSTLISEMLEQSGIHTWLGGNIGTPLLDKVPQMRKEDVAVVELSSFQLMTMEKSPDIAIVTNVTPNHLDVHKSMEEYIEAKYRICAAQDGNSRAVLNYDNEITREFGEKALAEVVYFSRQVELHHGVYLKGYNIVVAKNGENKNILDIRDIKIPGMHNVENYMAAIASLEGIVQPSSVEKVAKSFGGVEHRIEFVREKDGVKYYNDSIASSPTRTIAGLHSFGSKVILLAGGYDKHIPFEPLAQEIPSHVKLLILMGATKEKIRAALDAVEGEKPPVIEVDSFDDSVKVAYEHAERGDIVLFSPACASFDMFPNFMVRGERFKNLVNSL